MADQDTDRHFSQGQADHYDRAYGQVTGFPHTAPASLAVGNFLGIGGVRNYTVQTFRVPDVGDSIFVIVAGPEGLQRVHLPPETARLVLRQHDALTTQARKRGAKARAVREKKAGIVPGFKRGKK
jgi:hypothetical protein